MKVPGVGVRPYGGDVAMAENGVITFGIGIHGIPVTMDANNDGDIHPQKRNFQNKSPYLLSTNEIV